MALTPLNPVKMVRKGWAAIILACCSFGASADELLERALISNKASIEFQSKQIDVLEKDAGQYLKSGARTSSGIWKLSVFYKGLAGIANQQIKDEAYWSGFENQALKWAAAYPNSPAPHLVYADLLVSHAWMYRGTGWASEVRKEDWKPFGEHLKKAESYLKSHKAVASRDPRWYELMIIIAKGEGWDLHDFVVLVDEATSRYPYFYQIYFAAIDYLTPKWNGSKEEIETFAQWAVKKTRAVEGEALYARIYWYASQTNYSEKLFTDSDVVWSRMSKSIDDVLKRYPDQWNINNFAYFSCLAGDARKTASLISRITGEPVLSAWKSMAFYQQCKAWSSSKPEDRENPTVVNQTKVTPLSQPPASGK